MTYEQERRVPKPRHQTANQVVSANLRHARALRGWTQEQAAERVAPHLGSTWKKSTWSMAENYCDRDPDDRPRHFDADDLLAFSLAFELPIGWFLLPPEKDIGVGPIGAEEYASAWGLLHAALGLSFQEPDVHERVRDLVAPISEGGVVPDETFRDMGLAADLAATSGVAAEVLHQRQRQLETTVAAMDGAREILAEMSEKLREVGIDTEADRELREMQGFAHDKEQSDE